MFNLMMFIQNQLKKNHAVEKYYKNNSVKKI